jgi:hypothetical protein
MNHRGRRDEWVFVRPNGARFQRASYLLGYPTCAEYAGLVTMYVMSDALKREGGHVRECGQLVSAFKNDNGCEIGGSPSRGEICVRIWETIESNLLAGLNQMRFYLGFPEIIALRDGDPTERTADISHDENQGSVLQQGCDLSGANSGLSGSGDRACGIPQFGKGKGRYGSERGVHTRRS